MQSPPSPPAGYTCEDLTRESGATMPPRTRADRRTRHHMGHIRGHGCRDLLVYCSSPRCNHDAQLNGDRLPDETVLLDLDPRMVCAACGLIGADMRRDCTPMTGSGCMGGAHSLS